MPTSVHRRIRCSLAAIALACSLVAAHADTGFTPQSGTWIVSGELDGKPGRGMAIDVQDGVIVMQVYNYREGGSATFHLATGSVVDNQVSAPLLQYRGGRYFGSAARSGVEDGNAGDVQIRFTSGSAGTVQFPGEAPVAMQRYRFDGTAPDKLLGRYWIVALLDESGNAAYVLSALTGMITGSGENDKPGLMLDSQFGRSGTHAACQYTQASYSFRCLGDGLQAEFKEYVRQLMGSVTMGGKTYRMLGLRVLEAKGGVDMDALMAQYLAASPDSGTWIVSSELDGKPGRGMAIDVQNGTLVMQVYNYDAAGDATFHLAQGPYQMPGQAEGALKRYAGGRWFGSGARSGSEAADAGMVYLAFDSTTRGVVRFPGEGPLAIERYRFGVQAPDPRSLLGTWALSDLTNDRTVTLHLTDVVGDAAADGKVRCRYTDAATGEVRCTDSAVVSRDETKYATDYRFAVQGGMAYGKALPANLLAATGTVPDDSKIKPGTLYGLRLVDRHGVQAGLGPLR